MFKLLKKVLHHPMLHKQTIVQATVILSIINILSKFIGYVRQMLIAKYFGATGFMDAYVIGLQVPTLVLGLFAAGLGSLFIPMYISHKQKDPQEAKRYVSQILFVWGSMFLVVSLLTAVFAPFLVKIVAYGFSGERFDFAVAITRLLALYGFVNILNTLFQSLLRAEKQFIIPTITTSFVNIINVLIILFLSKIYGIYCLVIGSYVMLFINVFINMFLLISKYKIFNFKNFYINWFEIKEFFILLTPIILSSGVGTLNEIIDRTIASTLPDGSIAAIQYSQKIWTLPAVLFVGSIASTILPLFSELALNRFRILEYKKSINKIIIVMIYLLIPSSIFLILFSLPITRLFYQRGAFDPHATALTSFVNQMYCIGILFMALYPILLSVFYSFKKTLTPLLISIFAVGLNLIGNIVLSRYIGVGGIALSTSLSQIIGFLAAYFFLAKYFNTNENSSVKTGENLIVEFIKVLISTLPLIAIGIVLFPWLNLSSPFIIQAFKFAFITLLLGLVFYFSFALLKTKGQEIAKSYFLRGVIGIKLMRL